MQFSKETLTLLNNFRDINSNLMLRATVDGVTSLSTMSPQKSIIATTTIPEVIDNDFGIYDLKQFLSVLGMFADPEIRYTSTCATVGSGQASIKFYAADESVLSLPPKKEIRFPTTHVSINFTPDHLSAIDKASGVLDARDVILGGDGKNLYISVVDAKGGATGNSFRVDIGETDKTFKAAYKKDNLKLLPMEYTIDIAKQRISRWTSKDGKLSYLIALETTSVFE